MTLEETVEYFRDMVEGCGAYELCPCFHDDMEMTKIALSALEKQIPKKPRDEESDWAICPVCGGSVSKKNVWEHIVNEEITFCEHCGQALGWRDTE